MGRNLIETIMGAVVLLVAGFFLVFAYNHSSMKEIKGYEITAQFTSVGGVEDGSDVRINGIKVGTVAGHALDPQTFNAVVRLSISPDIKLPKDTVASVASEGLLGGKYIKLDPGRSQELIAVGGAIGKTKEFKSIEEMVGELIFLATADNSAEAAPGAQAAPGGDSLGIGGSLK